MCVDVYVYVHLRIKRSSRCPAGTAPSARSASAGRFTAGPRPAANSYYLYSITIIITITIVSIITILLLLLLLLLFLLEGTKGVPRCPASAQTMRAGRMQSICGAGCYVQMSSRAMCALHAASHAPSIRSSLPRTSSRSRAA